MQRPTNHVSSLYVAAWMWNCPSLPSVQIPPSVGSLHLNTMTFSCLPCSVHLVHNLRSKTLGKRAPDGGKGTSLKQPDESPFRIDRRVAIPSTGPSDVQKGRDTKQRYLNESYQN